MDANETKATGGKAKARGLGSVFQRGSVWWIAFYRDGQRYRESSESDNRAVAVRLLKRRLAEAQSGKPMGVQVEKTTLNDLQGILLDHYRMNAKRSTKRAAQALNHLLDHFDRDCRANAITGDRVNRYVVERQQAGAANATINRELAALKRSFSLAYRVGRVAVIPHISTLAENNARQGFVESADFDAIHALLPEYLKDAIRFLYLSGWRKAEMQSLEWRDVYADCIRLRSENSKNGRPRELPLLGELASIIDRARNNRRLDTPYVFHRDGRQLRDFRSSWETACRQAGRAGLLIHDLRRSAIRHMVRAGVSEQIAMALSGHKTRSTFARYNITTSDDLRNAVARVNDFLSNPSAEPARVVALPTALSARN